MSLKNIWRDETGGVLSIELVLIATIVGLGAITGLTSTRDGVITELADVGGAVSYLNQSYILGGIKAHCATTAGTNFEDFADFCDDEQLTNECNSRCLVVCTPATGELSHNF
jgi:Flp pilus assembly pilin Flp